MVDENAMGVLSLTNANFNANESYIAPTFHETVAIDVMHHAPRMGNPNNITLLMTGSEEERRRYVIGLMAMSILILTVFLTWTLVLLILKCLGHKVGCASGMPKEVMYDNIQPNQFEDDLRKAERSLFWTRIVFLLAGVCALGSTISFVCHGIGSLRKSVQGARNSVYRVENMTAALYNGSNDFLQNQEIVSEESKSLTSENEWCPALTKPDFIPPNDALNQTFQELKNLLTQVNSAISDLQSNVVEIVTGIRDVLGQAEEKLAEANEQMERVNVVFVIAICMAIIQGMIILFMIIGVILAWFERLPTPFRCMQSYILLPIFLLSMFISIIFSVVFVIGALAISDFCYPTPDQTIQTLLRASQEQIGSFVVETSNYYVTGCKGTDPLNPAEYVNMATSAVDVFRTFTEFIHNSIDDLTSICGETSTILHIVNIMNAALDVFSTVVDVLARLLHCSTINGLYTEVTYSTICENGANALYGIFLSQLLMAIFSMIMVTLRVSWQQVEGDGGGYVEGSTPLLPPTPIIQRF